MYVQLTALILVGVTALSSLGQQSWVTPYQSLEDSPFQDFGIADTLTIEDFEDGELNQPGVTLLPPTGPHQGYVAITSTTASTTANSVGEDSGDPLTGSFLLGIPQFCATTFPPLCPATVNLQFDKSYGLPTFVGFVWTDAVRTKNPSVELPFSSIRVYGANGEELGFESAIGLPSFDEMDVTSDDIFIGFLDYQGIHRLEFLVVTDQSGGGLSMDHLQFGKSAIQGDTNLDGKVEFDDFLILAEEFGGTGTWRQGDFNFDGVISFGDFLLLSENFGMSVLAAAPMTVPEPSSTPLVLGLLGLGLLLTRSRRQCFLQSL